MNFVMDHVHGAGSMLDMLTCSPACYHCATDAPPELYQEKIKVLLTRNFYFITAMAKLGISKFKVILSGKQK